MLGINQTKPYTRDGIALALQLQFQTSSAVKNLSVKVYEKFN